MCISDMPLNAAYQAYQKELLAAGLLVSTGVDGLYGRSGLFEQIVAGIEAELSTIAAPLAPEVLRFPPLMSRASYCKTDHLELFPELMGSVHSFVGNQREHLDLMRLKNNGEQWATHLTPTEMMATPAACFPLYPTASGILSEEGRTIDLQSYIFRHEPSMDPARMQMFRQREFVRLGSPAQAQAHRDEWLEKGMDLFGRLGLQVQKVLANDPFFGRGGELMATTQKEQKLKYEIVTAICSNEKMTAISSYNYHLDHFGKSFNIQAHDLSPAHSSCVGFGLERITLALLKTHGFVTKQWPNGVRQQLSL